LLRRAHVDWEREVAAMALPAAAAVTAVAVMAVAPAAAPVRPAAGNRRVGTVQ
jgi:hypothetical protein